MADNRPWPKKLQGDQGVTDKEKLKEEYLSNPFYSWVEFCRSQGYAEDRGSKVSFPVKAWQKEWILRQTEIKDESLVNEAIKVRTEVLQKRLAFPKQNMQLAENLKALAVRVINRYVSQANEDEANELAKAKDEKGNPLPKKFNMGVMELRQLAGALKTIQEFEIHGLLMPTRVTEQEVLRLPQADPEAFNEDAELARLQSVDVGLIGGRALDENSITAIMNKWLGNQSQTIEVEGGEIIDDQDAPLTPLEEQQ